MMYRCSHTAVLLSSFWLSDQHSDLGCFVMELRIFTRGTDSDTPEVDTTMWSEKRALNNAIPMKARFNISRIDEIFK